LSLPDHVQQVLKEIQERLRSRGVKASWTKSGNLHLSLKFLGNVQVQGLYPIISAMNNAAESFFSFQLSAGGLGFFPGIKKARVIWSGIGGRTDNLENICKSLESHLQAVGIKKEKRRFSPHITLGRSKSFLSPAELISLIRECKDTRSRSFEPAGLDLFKSELTPFGAIHTPLSRAKLSPKEKK